MRTFFLATALALPATSAEKLDFNRDVRPILSNTCFQCHGFDENTREGGLRLDDREAAIEAGAIVPGDPGSSEIIYRIQIVPGEDEDDELMPPADLHKPLSEQDKEVLIRWVAEGAEYAPHWSYIPPVRPALPQTAQSGALKTPPDHFVAARQDEAGLAFSPEAQPATLARRLSLDLIGLPPTPRRVGKFVREHRASPDAAVSAYIEELLASPHFGERLAVPYLDMVRFADTVGYHGDQNQRIFPYRDYVIQAFNTNKPYDRFITEQIAGDLLPGAGTEQHVATGFNRLNMMTREGSAQAKEYLAKYQSDRVRTVSTAFLGSTMACAECHDHKYDPFSIKDFYSMAAYFADVKQWGIYSTYSYTPNPDLAGFTNDHPFPPEIEVESPYLLEKIQRHWEELDALASETNGVETAQFTRFARENPDGWLAVNPNGITSEKGTPAEIHEGHLVQLRGAPRDKEAIRFTIPPQRFPIAAVRIEPVATGLNDHRLARGSHESIRVNLSFPQPAGGKKEGDTLSGAIAHGGSPVGYRGGRPRPPHEHGWRFATDEKPAGSGLLAVDYYLDRPARGGLELTLHPGATNAFRISVSPLAGIGLRPAGEVDPEADARLAALLQSDKNPKKERARALRHAIFESDRGKAFTMVTEAVDEPAVTRVLPRGDWQDDSGEVLAPATPAFLGGTPSPDATRLDLASWITSPENPLTARHFVNVLWAQFFGHGLSRTLEDLGNQGEWPTHPELLDWLAVEFVESGWDVKHMVRLITRSATYRQSSRGSASLAAADPANLFYARQLPRRLDAEFIRDNALAIAGLLERQVGGPSARPYQPAGYYANLNFPLRQYHGSTGTEQYRRGLYSHWQRTFLHPMLANFDAPGREECAVSRPASNTPQQALTLLNDPTFVEAARVFAGELFPAAQTFDGRLTHGFARALGRPPGRDERNYLHAHYARQLVHYQRDRDAAEAVITTGNSPRARGDAAELAAFTSVARIILNLHETITRF